MLGSLPYRALAAVLAVAATALVSSMAPATTETSANASAVSDAGNVNSAANCKPLVIGSGLVAAKAPPRAISRNQVDKNPRPVQYRPGHGPPAALAQVTAGEWADRVELAAMTRILYLYGFGNDLAAQCALARVRDEPETMLSNEWGFFFEETTASSLVKTDVGRDAPPEGLHVDPATGARVGPENASLTNMGCVPVARAIFRARPDVNVILHVHPHAVMAISGTERGLLPLSQAAFFFHGQVTRYRYEFSYGANFEEDIAAGFRSGERVMILNHHGLYAVGRNAAEAWFAAFHVNQAAEVQLKAMSTGADLEALMPSEADLKKQYEDFMTSPDYACDGSREWAGCVRKLNRELPGYEF